MSIFTDNIFSEKTSVSVNSLTKNTDEPLPEIVQQRFSEDESLKIIENGYQILIVKTMQYITDKSLQENRQLLLDIIFEYSGLINFNHQIFEEKSGFVPLNKTICTYFIAINPNKNIRALLNLLISLDNIGKFDNTLKIYTSDKLYETNNYFGISPLYQTNIFYGYYNSEILPNDNWIQYLKDLKYNDLPFYFKKEFEDNISKMRFLSRAGLHCMLEPFKYEKSIIDEELNKWLRTSKQHWVAGQIEDREIDYNEYNEKAKEKYGIR